MSSDERLGERIDGLFNGIILIFAFQFLILFFVAGGLLISGFAIASSLLIASLVVARLGAGWNRALWRKIKPGVLPDDEVGL